MRKTNLALAIGLGLFVAACASVEKVGTASYAPLSAANDVTVLTAESQVSQPFEVLAKISYSDPGKFQRLSLSDAFEPLKTRAREVGANGVIIDSSNEIVSGIISRGISVEARGIRLPTPAAAAVSPQGSAKDAADALRQLQKLHDERVITDHEYEQKKAELLRRL